MGGLCAGKNFAATVQNYCTKICSMTSVDQIGCNCDVQPVETTLPVIAFQAPAAGLISVGVFAFVCSIVGCAGAIREKQPILIAYIVLLFLIIVMQFGFGVAAAAVASGQAPEIAGPFVGILNENYRYFDWEMLSLFLSPACYHAYSNETIVNPFDDSAFNMTFHYPACDFYGKCAGFYTPGYVRTSEEAYCCNAKSKSCDTSKVICMSGNDCIISFLGKIAAP